MDGPLSASPTAKPIQLFKKALQSRKCFGFWHYAPPLPVLEVGVEISEFDVAIKQRRDSQMRSYMERVGHRHLRNA
jgi:hypothetical protein